MAKIIPKFQSAIIISLYNLTYLAEKIKSLLRKIIYKQKIFKRNKVSCLFVTIQF